MQIRINNRHKSIEPMPLPDLPNFTVVSGVNGSGKTHLLEAIAASGTDEQNSGQALAGQVAHFAGLPEITGLGGGSFKSFEGIKGRLYEEVKAYCAERLGDEREDRTPRPNFMFEPIWQEVRKKHPDDIGALSPESLQEIVGKKRFVRQRPGTEANFISQIFLDYRYHQILAKGEEGLTEEQILARYGPPPWELFREVVRTLELPIEIDDPADTKFAYGFNAKLTHIVSGEIVKVEDLSTGERGILALAMWLFRSGSNGIFPPLILLDEPDSHLHPSFVHKLISFINDVLIAKHGCHVIITTHSPTTVALAPEDSLYEMLPNPSSLVKSTSRLQAIANLTGGHLTILPNTRSVLTEFWNDKSFYEATYKKFLVSGEISRTHDFTFSPAIRRHGENAEQEAGGRENVRVQVNQANETNLNGLIKGIIDRDQDNEPTENTIVIPRYCLENYLTDPILIHAALSLRDPPPEIDGVDLKFEKKRTLENVPVDMLQKIIDHYSDKIQESIVVDGDGLSDQVEISYLHGPKLKVRRWQIEISGKKIRSAYCEKLGGRHLRMDRLINVYEKYEIVPMELLGVFKSLLAE